MFNRKEYMEKYNKQWNKDNPEKVRERSNRYYKNHRERINKLNGRRNIKRNYGLSHEDWLKMWEDQSGKCAICGKSFVESSNACVDHDHETDEIRGLLCRKCNRGIGFLNDDPRLTMKATEYLLRKEK